MNGVTVLNTIQGDGWNYFFLALFVLYVVVFFITAICKLDVGIFFYRQL